MKYIISILLIASVCISVTAQTPYDSFAPETSRPMLDIDALSAEEQPVLSQDTLFCIAMIDLQQQTLSLVRLPDGEIIASSPITDDIRKWMSVDPLADKYPGFSPYAYCAWNPVKYIDSDGRRPVYDLDGNLLGTDEKGLQGDPLVMDPKLFTQGMSQEVAEGFDVGVDFLNEDKRNSLQENHKGLSNRPDWDGQLSLSEANNWYRNGHGKPLYVDAAKIDLSPLSKSDFSSIGSSKYVNFLDPRSLNTLTGLVYGTIQVTLIGDDGTVRLGKENGLLDVYNFDMQKGRGFRNIATQFGSIVAGNGTSFNIYHYGHGKVK